MRRNFKVLYSALIVLVLLASVILIFGYIEKVIDEKNSDQSLSYTDNGNDRVFYKDKSYVRNNYLDTILLIGIDSLQESAEKQYTQADFIALLIIDNLDKSYRVLHINRDTVTEIVQLDDRDQKNGTYTAQIALSHTYGSTEEVKCINTMTAVRNLLYGISINHYLSLTMDAVPLINDSVGGVTLTLESDFPILGEEYLKGTQVTLQGEQALTFVRWRNNDETNSNLERMERQRQYMEALAEKYYNGTENMPLETLQSINDHLVSDYATTQIPRLFGLLKDYEYKGITVLKGEASKHGNYVEYHIDEDAAQATVIDLFYTESND